MNARRKRLDDNADNFIFGNEKPDQKTTGAAKKTEKKSNNLLDKLIQESTPRERPIRVSLDLSPEMHSKLTNLANRTGRKKAEILRVLLEQAFEEIDFD
ncbi:MAG: CopG family transcriptional regulator [Nostoc sp. C3-bin3]|nr:CopG family transcriptional regulator [Nostoc sp. C3-bin3]